MSHFWAYIQKNVIHDIKEMSAHSSLLKHYFTAAKNEICLYHIMSLSSCLTASMLRAKVNQT